MRINEKKKQDFADSADAQSPPSSASFQSTSSSGSDTSFDNKRLNPIDVLMVDRQSRLTLTKKVKRVIPLNPEDKIAVYQDMYNKDIVLKVQYHNGQHQREGEEEEKKKLEKWVLTIRKEVGNPNIKKTTVSTTGSGSNLANDEDDGSLNHHHHHDGHKSQAPDKYRLKNKENPLFSTPILLVDDDPDVLLAFGMFLRAEGYSNIKEFSSSKATLKYLLDLNSPLQYKLAVIDIRMPNINGIQLYQMLRILNPSLKILFSTGLDAVNELTSIYSEVRSVDILRKPLERDQFIKAVNDKVIGLAGSYA